MITPEQIDRALDLFERFVTAFEYEMDEGQDDQAEFAIGFIPDGPLDS